MFLLFALNCFLKYIYPCAFLRLQLLQLLFCIRHIYNQILKSLLKIVIMLQILIFLLLTSGSNNLSTYVALSCLSLSLYIIITVNGHYSFIRVKPIRSLLIFLTVIIQAVIKSHTN